MGDHVTFTCRASETSTVPSSAVRTTVTVEVSDALQVNITDSPNSPPGKDQVVEGATVTLSGTVSDDDPEDAPTYEWTHDGAPSDRLRDPAALSPRLRRPTSATPLVTVTLTADDGTVEVSDALQVNITDSPNGPSSAVRVTVMVVSAATSGAVNVVDSAARATVS